MTDEFDVGFDSCDKDEYVLEVGEGSVNFTTSDLVDLCDLIVAGNCKNLGNDLDTPRAYLFFKALYDSATEAIEARGIDLHAAVEEAENDLAAFNTLTGRHTGVEALKQSEKIAGINIDNEKEN